MAKIISEKEAVRWVAENIVPYENSKVKEKDAPNAMAWALLKDVCGGQFERKDFWNLWSKLLPTKAQLERENEVETDTEKLEGLIDEFDREVFGKSAEDVKGESAIPEEDIKAWGFKRRVGAESEGNLQG
jgi:hypothetical protein